LVHEHLSHLRLDRRLLRRRGWVPQKELDKELSALPDVQSKARTAEEDEAAEKRQETAPAGD
jgi:hypothetical protein